MLKTILGATVQAARSDRALQRALAIAHERQADVEILHVVDDDWPRKIIDQLEESARTALAEQVAAVPRSREVRISTVIIRG